MGAEDDAITGEFAVQLRTVLCEETENGCPRGVPKPVFDAVDVQTALRLWQHGGRSEV